MGLVTQLLLTCCVFLLFPYSSSADFSGQVVSVLDGDTIEVLHNGKAQRIRLQAIDCPEKGQPFGKIAKWATSALVFGRTVTVQGHDKDKYKRLVADVLLADETNVNQKLVKDGWCWWYRKYAPGDTVLEVLEAEAREARRGVWALPNPVPPWEWRKAKREQKVPNLPVPEN